MTAPTFWVSGYPGAGKTEVCRGLEYDLRLEGKLVVTLDGDDWRSATNFSNHSPDGRWRNITELAKFAKTLNRLGYAVFVPTCSPQLDLRVNLARALIENYHEITIDCPVPICRSRQPELYAKADAGVFQHYPGVHCEYEVDPNADLIINGAAPRIEVRERLRRYVEEVWSS